VGKTKEVTEGGGGEKKKNEAGAGVAERSSNTQCWVGEGWLLEGCWKTYSHLRERRRTLATADIAIGKKKNGREKESLDKGEQGSARSPLAYGKQRWTKKKRRNTKFCVV